MTEKFTPGPWEHCIFGGEAGYPLIFEKKTGLRIASVFIQNGDCENGIANATLVHAAPDMYRVLSGICFEKSARICNYAPESCKVCFINKALKKARGEE